MTRQLISTVRLLPLRSPHAQRPPPDGFVQVDFKETKKREEGMLDQLVRDNPDLSIPEMVEQTGMTKYAVSRTLTSLGWHSVKGGSDGHSPWHKDGPEGCPYEKGKKGKSKKGGVSKPDVDFGDSTSSQVTVN